MNQLGFLQAEFPEVHDAARRAERLANSDPRAACFYARRALELAVAWAYRHDPALQLPYRDDLSALIHEPTFKSAVGQAVFYKCRAIKDLGNEAVHSTKQLSVQDAISAVRELFHVCYWLARTYAQGAKPDAGVAFDPNQLPHEAAIQRQTVAQLKALSEQLTAEREKLFTALADRDSLDEELKRVRAEITTLKKQNEATPDSHNYSEQETRDLFIDLLLREAGWLLDQPRDREFEVTGMPNEQGKGYVDYVLWGDNGLPLAVVEAKRTRKDPRVGQTQAKLYADCLENQFGQRPVIFYTNGYEHWMWDDSFYPPRPVQGFYKKAELELLVQRRKTRRSLQTATINDRIVERYYQTRALRRIGEAFEKDRARRALLVMATGSGKTRTVIALADMLIRSNWAKRVLFLADRTALVNQAVKAFQDHLPDSAPVNLVTNRNGEGRVYVSTYPTMIGLIDEGKGAQRRFGPGHFDLIIIDEAHRSVFMKYRSIFEYFDSLLVGLTATPKDEIDRNTYSLFDLEDGVPTDAYGLEQAVADGYLVPAKSVSVPLRLPAQGITYDQLSEEDKEQFDLTDWKEREEDVKSTGRVEAAAINQWVFNEETVDKVLKHLMERGLKVDQGDKLGKTIIFAKNHEHAKYIALRFNKHYGQYAGHFAQVIDFQNQYAQALIDSFSDPTRMPQMAISVDMLDTGIDVPEVVNLVFFKQVRSKTKFWQMVGRGTRLCKDLFGPGLDKKFFFIFDYCGNLEFFSQDPEGSDGAAGTSLSKRLFIARLRLLTALSKTASGIDAIKEHIAAYQGELPKSDEEVWTSIVELLQAEVRAMNTDNFIVRGKRKLVEKFQDKQSWQNLTDESLHELEHELAGLPTEQEPDNIEAKQFDLLILRLQLGMLRGTKQFVRDRRAVQELAAVLEEAKAIPMIAQQLELIQDLQTDGWWEDVTVPMLEVVRRRLRDLIKLIEPKKSSAVFPDLSDDLGDETEIELPGFSDSAKFERFREKLRAFLTEHLSHPAVQKLRLNEPFSEEDLNSIEELLRQPAVDSPDLLVRARQDGLPIFVRSLIGLERGAAQALLSTAISDLSLSGTQIEFLEMLIHHLCEKGMVDPSELYDSPYTDVAPSGPESLFSPTVARRLRVALAQSIPKVQ